MSDGRVLVDTSVWVAFFRGGETELCDRLDALLDAGRVVLSGVVEMELLQGLRPYEQVRISDLLGALDYVDAERADFTMAGQRLGALRRRFCDLVLCPKS